MAFSSLVEIRDRFGFARDEGLEEIRNQLKSLITKNHPDVTGGNFKSSEQETNYYAARDAASFIDDLPKEQNSVLDLFRDEGELTEHIVTLVKTNIEGLVQEVADLQVRLNAATEENVYQEKFNKINQLEDETVRGIQQSSEKFRLPKYVPYITISLLVPVLAVIWLVPQRINNNPALEALIDTRSIYFTYMWVSLAALVLLIWATAWVIERRYQVKYTLYATESTQEVLYQKFREFVNLANMGKFKKAHLTRFVYFYDYPQSNIGKWSADMRQVGEEAKKAREQLDRKQNGFADSIVQIEREKTNKLNKIFREFENYQISPGIFSQIAGIIDLETAEQVAEIIIQRGLLNERFESTSPSGLSIDTWLY